ncbi:hypothetical protein [uncultured Kordia sp.]|uniref:hypothetical protein n=1 Tax=uncultured Kordia sp. TaxID=507699 RepID=UPI00262FBEEA|nr:hypothetical protein [uncultured Kordia sp.]
MKNIQQFVIILFLGAALTVSAQETTEEIPSLDKEIENFELPTFSKLSNDIASEYNAILESLPDLSNIGPYIDQELRRGAIFDQHSVSSSFRNFANENSLFQNISTRKFELRTILNNIMYLGHDINQLHLSDAHKATGN